MQYNFNGKNIRIPDEDIERIVKGLKVSKEDAIQIWLEDEEYLDNEIQNQLCETAKENRITATIHQAKANKPKTKTQRERTVKPNPTKEMIIEKIAELLPNFAENIVIVNKGKLITFTIGENNFKIDLIQQRKPKKE